MTTARIFATTLAAALLQAQAALADEAPLFAAPAVGHASSSSATGSMGQVTLALAVVLAFVFVAAWAVRHLRKLNLSGTTQHLQVVSQVTLGTKERAVLIRVNEVHVLVGVAPGQVTALHTFSAPIGGADATAELGQSSVASTATATTPTFQALLKKSLGLSR